MASCHRHLRWSLAEHVVHLTRNLVAFGYKVYTVAASGRKRDVPDIRQENHGDCCQADRVHLNGVMLSLNGVLACRRQANADQTWIEI